MAASDARPIPRKNVAFRATFPIYDADGDLVTGATGLDSEVSKDGGTFADATSEATELATSSGVYYLDLTADEMNADTVAIIVKTSSSGAKTTVLVLYPEEAGDVRADVVAISGDSAAADNLEAAADGTGYNLGGGSVVAASVTGAVGSVAGHTPQTGDSFARIGAAGAGLTAVGDTSGTTTLLSRITALLQTKAEADTAHGLLATSASLTAAQAALAALIAALNDITAADVWTALDDASANKIADHVLRRSWATAAGSADGDALAFRSLLGAVAKLVNRVGISGATLTVYEDDDLTALGTQAVTSDAAAEPITGVNTV